MSKGEHKSPDFLKIQQPLVKDRHFKMEAPRSLSRAIWRYLCEKYVEKGNKGLYGSNPSTAKGTIDQWLEAGGWRLKAEGRSFNPPSSVLVFKLAFAPWMRIKQDQAVINQKKLAKVLEAYEKRLGESRFLAGDEFSLADLSHLLLIDRGQLFTSKKNVGRWWGEISSRDSSKKVVDMQKQRIR